jgi:hypothetical protein
VRCNKKMSEEWLRKVMEALKVKQADKHSSLEAVPKIPKVGWKNYGKNW